MTGNGKTMWRSGLVALGLWALLAFMPGMRSVAWAQELSADSLHGQLFAGPTPEEEEELKRRGMEPTKENLEAIRKDLGEEERKKNASPSSGPPKRFRAIGAPGGIPAGRPGLLPVGQVPPDGTTAEPGTEGGPGTLKKGRPGSTGASAQAAPPAPPAPPAMAQAQPDVPVRELPKNEVNKPTKEGEREGFNEFQSDERYHLDYYDAELVDFIKQMSEKFKVNFILSDKVKGGKITIVSPNPVTREEAWQAFLSVLESKNLSLVKIGKFYKILPRNEAGRAPIKTYLNGGTVEPTDEMITYLLRVQNIDLKEMENILKEMKSKDGQIITFEPTSTLIITDAAVNIRRMAKIVEELDVPNGRDVIHVIDIYYAAASDVAASLQEIFGDKGGKSGGAKAKNTAKGKSSGTGDGGDAEPVSLTNVISDERTNQLIIVAPRTAMPKILDLINRLDVPIPGDGQVHVYYCENANAEELAQTLTGLASGRGAKPAAGKGKSGQAGASSAELFEGEVKVTADKSTNSLVVVASTKDYNALKKVIQQLDIRRRQVFVEAVIMEVTLSKNRTLGMAINGGYAMNIGGETVPIYAATTMGTQSSIIMDPTTLSGLAVGLQGPDLKGTEGMIPGMDGAIPAFGVLLQMIQTDSDANVLSTPHILTMDNEEAEIIVGSNVPFITGSARDSNNQPVLSIQRQDVALSMKIKPQINESDYVRLEVNQEITELVSISETLGPTTTKRAAKSVVVVKDNQTIVIGGLLRDRETNDAEKVPFLGDLPVFGRLFRRDKEGKEKTNLLIFLTCHIIKDDEDFKRIFKRKMEERNEFLRRFYGQDDDYEFETDFTQKVGLVETIRATVEQERVRMQKEDEQRQRELVITPDDGHNVYEIGLQRGKYEERPSEDTKETSQAAEPKSTEITPDELMKQLTSRPGRDNDDEQ